MQKRKRSIFTDVPYNRIEPSFRYMYKFRESWMKVILTDQIVLGSIWKH